MAEVIATTAGLGMLAGAYLYGVAVTRRYYRKRVIPEVYQDGIDAGIRESRY